MTGRLTEAAPGAERYADEGADIACLLADEAHMGGLSAKAADDILETINTLTATLAALGPDLAGALAPMTAAAAEARRLLDLATEEEPQTAPLSNPPHSAGRRGRRALGLGPNFKGVRSKR